MMPIGAFFSLDSFARRGKEKGFCIPYFCARGQLSFHNVAIGSPIIIISVMIVKMFVAAMFLSAATSSLFLIPNHFPFKLNDLQ